MRRKWLPIQFKRALRRPGTYVIALLLLISFLLVNYVKFYEREQAPFGLITNGGVCAEAVAKMAAQSGDTPVPCKMYEDENRMRRDILTGRLDCGFILQENLDEAVFEETEEPAVTYLHTAATRKGLIVREKIYTALINAKSEQILNDMAHSKKSFKNGDDELARRLIERKDEYLESDAIFHVVFETVDGGDAQDRNRTTDPLTRRIRLIWVLIAAAALAFGRERYTSGFSKAAKAVRPGERLQSLTAFTVSSAAPAAVLLLAAGIASAAMAGGGLGAGAVALSILSCTAVLLVSGVLASGLALVIRHETAYLYAVTALVAAASLGIYLISI